ncbi:MAG: hypothetical protein WCB11_23075, partial [Terriglobales bacterium]
MCGQIWPPGLTGTLNSAALNNEFATVPEPRIGFAYDVGGKHNTVIRAGYGIYSVREDIGGVDNLAFAPPFYPLSFPGGTYASLATMYSPGGVPLLPPLGSAPQAGFVPTPSFFQGFGGGPTTGAAQFSGTAADFFAPAVPLHWVSPTTQQWNLSVQRQLGGNWVLEVGYVGTKGTRLRSTFDPDQP